MSRPAYRKNLVHQAVVTATLGLGSLTAHAVSLDQAEIQSAQHEPLSATINVSNIDAAKFNASIADSNTYQQMGLSQDEQIQVKFTPTSESTGKITLSSTAPISKPFADVVLNLNNNGEQVIEPQTLLMPMPRSGAAPAGTGAPIMVAAPQAQNLPVVSNTPVVAGAPLQVQNSAPPPLFPEVNLAETSAGFEPAADMTASTTAAPVFVPMSEIEAHQAPMLTAAQPPVQSGDANVDNLIQNAGSTAQNEAAQIAASLSPESTNTQLEALTGTITRRYFPAGTAPASSPAAPLAAETPVIKASTNNTETVVAEEKDTQTNAAVETQSSTGAVYVVQRGDNLWSIANEIAKANNIAITDVMSALHSQNPDAFNKGNANRLKANTTLSIPSYDVVPSQKAISNAIAAKREALSAKKSSSSKATTNTQAKASSKGKVSGKSAQQNIRAATTRPKTTAKPLPKAQMTLVTASTNGQATGAGTKTGKAGGNGGNSDLVATLKSTRSQTAASATRLNGLNQSLSAATHKLQVQNQRLAELEARLKALKDK